MNCIGNNCVKNTAFKTLKTVKPLISGVSLKSKLNILSMICNALFGQSFKLRSNTVLLNCKGFTGAAATDGRNIFLPETLPYFGLFKLMALHQAILIQKHLYKSPDGIIPLDPVKMHLDADARLIRELPGLIHEMNRYTEEIHVNQYPEKIRNIGKKWKPWWGDILPDFIQDTDDTIELIKKRAIEKYKDLPQELLDALIAYLMKQDEREPDSLLHLLGKMLDQMEFTSPGPESLNENVQIFFYREWDRKIAEYKPEWCQVRQITASETPNTFVLQVKERLRGIILLVRRQLIQLKPEMFRRYKAQPTGDSLDIDALVQALTDMRSGAEMSENVYLYRDKKIRDVSVFFLVDLSDSTNEKINGQTIIDIQKEALAIMSDALETIGDKYAIYGFNSEGRFRVDMFKVKDFHDLYDEKAQYRLGNMQAQGLTRMGAAIRHALYKLEEVSTAVKLLIILTDGRPFDFEYGNLEYAIADTKKAIQEARSKKIHPFIITSDKKGRDYLKKISPHTECIILPKVELLPVLLPTLYRRLTG